MRLRSRFDHDLADLHVRVLFLGDSVRKTLIRANWALLHRDIAAARRVLHDESEIDRLRYGLEEYALQVLVRNQPFAGDLRTISACFGLAGELERIGDYAEEIGKVVVRTAGIDVVDAVPELQTMADFALDMLDRAIRAVDERDSGVAARLEASDDVIDDLYRQLFDTLVSRMQAHPAQIEAAIDVLWAAHNLERVGDRAVNIAERVAFMVSG